MIKNILIPVLLLTASALVRAQEAPRYSYHLDASLYEVLLDSVPTLKFYARQYIVMEGQIANRKSGDMAAALAAGELPAPAKDARLLSSIEGVVLTDPLNHRQVMEMLLARAGLANVKPATTLHQTLMYFHNISTVKDKPDFINHKLEIVIGTHTQKRPEIVTKYSAWNLRDGNVLRLGHFGDKELMKCVLKEAKEMPEAWSDAWDEEQFKKWLESISCHTQICAFSDSGLSLLPEEVQMNSVKGGHPSGFINVPFSCFDGEEPCIPIR